MTDESKARQMAESLYKDMAEFKTNCRNGTLLSPAVLCDYAGKMTFISWLEAKLAILIIEEEPECSMLRTLQPE